MSENRAYRKPTLTRQTANTFNLAAFGLPVLYNLRYKRYKLAAAFLILTIIPHLNTFMPSKFYAFIVYLVSTISIILAFYAGKTGNIAAYNSRNYENEKDFLRCQRLWLPITIIALVIHILVFPAQVTGHMNNFRMIQIREAEQALQKAMDKGIAQNDIIGQTTMRLDTPIYFSRYLDGDFDGKIRIIAPNGFTYYIRGINQDCGKISDNFHHGKKTACGYIRVDLNGMEKGPNFPSELYNLNDFRHFINRLLNHTIMGDMFTFYVYEDGVITKEKSVERYALKKFGRR